MSRFAQTFNALYRKLPFSDEGRTILRTWVEALRREIVGDPGQPDLVNLQDEANEVYDAIWIADGTGGDLDNWGEVLDYPRVPTSKTDPDYRAELLEKFRQANNALTLEMIQEGLEEIGGRFTPPLGVDAIHEHYKPYWGSPQPYGRRENGTDSADDYSLGEKWGLAQLDRLTFSVVVDRIPTQEEAFLLVAGDTTSPGLVDLKLAQSCGLIVNDLGTTPPSFRLRSMAYSVGVAPWLWSDNFERSGFDLEELGEENVSPLYDTFGDGAGGATWIIEDYGGGEDAGDGRLELVGYAANGAVGVPHVCVPRTDVEPIVLEESGIHVDVDLYIDDGSGSGYTDSAGLALRFDDSTGEMYALVFYGTAPYYYALYYVNDVGTWNQVIAPTATGTDMSISTRVQATLEDDYFTLIIDGTVKEERTNIGTALTSPGRWGLLTYGDDCNLIVEEFKYW